MAYLVIVHVPYTPLFKTNEKEAKEDVEKEALAKIKDINALERLRENINQTTGNIILLLSFIKTYKIFGCLKLL